VAPTIARNVIDNLIGQTIGMVGQVAARRAHTAHANGDEMVVVGVIVAIVVAAVTEANGRAAARTNAAARALRREIQIGWQRTGVRRIDTRDICARRLPGVRGKHQPAKQHQEAARNVRAHHTKKSVHTEQKLRLHWHNKNMY